MKKILILFSVFFLMICRERENDFAEKRKAEILLLYLADKKDKKKVCLEVMQKSQECLKETVVVAEAKEGDDFNEKSLSKYLSGKEGLNFKKESQNYTEFCESYSEELLENTSDRLQACNFSCDKDFWKEKQDSNQCRTSGFKLLVREGFTVKDEKTKRCIQSCFSYINTRISKDFLKDLKTYDFFKLLRKK